MEMNQILRIKIYYFFLNEFFFPFPLFCMAFLEAVLAFLLKDEIFS